MMRHNCPEIEKTHKKSSSYSKGISITLSDSFSNPEFSQIENIRWQRKQLEDLFGLSRDNLTSKGDYDLQKNISMVLEKYIEIKKEQEKLLVKEIEIKQKQKALSEKESELGLADFLIYEKGHLSPTFTNSQKANLFDKIKQNIEENENNALQKSTIEKNCPDEVDELLLTKSNTPMSNVLEAEEDSSASVVNNEDIEMLEKLLCKSDPNKLKEFLKANAALYDAERFSKDKISDFEEIELYEFIANEVCSAKNVKLSPRLDQCFSVAVELVQERGGDYLNLYDNHVSDSDSDIVSLSGELSDFES